MIINWTPYVVLCALFVGFVLGYFAPGEHRIIIDYGEDMVNGIDKLDNMVRLALGVDNCYDGCIYSEWFVYGYQNQTRPSDMYDICFEACNRGCYECEAKNDTR